MAFRPYPFQEKAIEAWRRTVRDEQYSSLIVLPTGAGKTVVGALIARDILSERQPSVVVWLVHREELKQQALDSFTKQGLDISVWDANEKNARGNVIVLMKDSARGFSNEFHKLRGAKSYVCLMIDEAHHEAAQTYKDIEESLNPDLKIGFTATPTRLDEAPLDFQSVAYQLNFAQVVKMGFLARPEYIRYKTNLPVRFHSRGNDFVRAELKEALDVDERNRLIVNEYVNRKDTYGKTLLFAIDVDHANHLRQMLDAKGIKAAVITGATRPASRRAFTEAFKSGLIDVLINVEIAIEGFDVKDIKTVFLCRPTKSEVYYMQMIGRGARRVEGVPAEKDFFYIVDFIDGSNHYARVADRWSQEHFGAEPDEEIAAAIALEDDINEYREFLSAHGMRPQRKDIEREVYQVDGILKCTNKSGKTKRFVLNNTERAIVDRYIQYVQGLARIGDYQLLMETYYRGHKIGKHFHRYTWATIAWAVFWRYVKMVELRQGNPVLEYVPFDLGATDEDVAAGVNS